MLLETPFYAVEESVQGALDAPRRGGPMNMEDAGQLIDGQAVEETRAQKVALFGGELGEGGLERLLDLAEIVGLEVRHLGVFSAEEIDETLRVRPGGASALCGQELDGGMQGHDLDPAQERAASLVLRDARRRFRRADEELFPQHLRQLIDQWEGLGGAGEEGRQMLEVLRFKGFEGAGHAVEAGTGQVEVRGVEAAPDRYRVGGVGEVATYMDGKMLGRQGELGPDRAAFLEQMAEQGVEFGWQPAVFIAARRSGGGRELRVSIRGSHGVANLALSAVQRNPPPRGVYRPVHGGEPLSLQPRPVAGRTHGFLKRA